MEFLSFVALPVLGFLWVVNFMIFIEKIKKGENTHNQKLLGGVWTFIFIIASTYFLLIIHEM